MEEAKLEYPVADKIMDVSQKMSDPVYMAELIINSRFLQRSRVQIPKNLRQFGDFLSEVISNVRHGGKMILLSIEGRSLEGYILFDRFPEK